jgi:hypothetical protein
MFDVRLEYIFKDYQDMCECDDIIYETAGRSSDIALVAMGESKREHCWRVDTFSKALEMKEDFEDACFEHATIRESITQESQR